MVTPAARRQAVTHLCSSFKVSQRWACEVIAVDRSSVRYVSVRPDDATIRVRLRELASVRRRAREAEATIRRGAAAGSPARRTQKSGRHKGSAEPTAGP